jgi:hypothetical protein
MALSEFSELWSDALDGLSALHGQPILFRQDRRANGPFTTIFCTKIELNTGETDKTLRRSAADSERLFGSFLIERRFFATDGDGQPILPGEYSDVRFNGRHYLASKANGMPICVPEDHEGLIYRFRTTDQGVY